MRRYGPRDDVQWRVCGKKRPIAYSTVAASLLIAALSQGSAAIQEVHDRINYDIEARKVLKTYTAKGYGSVIAKEFFN